jgi:hypothetical protein
MTNPQQINQHRKQIMFNPSIYKQTALALVAASDRETRSEFAANQSMMQRIDSRSDYDSADRDPLETIDFSFAIDWDYKG